MDFEEQNCATMGIFAPMVGIIGAMQAAEALKLISNDSFGKTGQSLAGRMLMLDGLRMSWTDMQVARQSNCPVCGNR